MLFSFPVQKKKQPLKSEIVPKQENARSKTAQE